MSKPLDHKTEKKRHENADKRQGRNTVKQEVNMQQRNQKCSRINIS